MAVACDQAIDGIADRTRHDPTERGEHGPDPTEIARRRQRGVGVGPNDLPRTAPFHPEQGVDRGQHGVTRADRRPVHPVTRGEADRATAIEAQNELHRPRTEGAVPVVDEERGVGRGGVRGGTFRRGHMFPGEGRKF